MKSRSNVYMIGFMVTLCMIVIDSYAHSNFRGRPRATRGFKNAALSTARGFGKRDGFGPRDVDEPGQVLAMTMMDFPVDSYKPDGEARSPPSLSPSERYSIEWLLEQLTKAGGPHWSKLANAKFPDKNGRPMEEDPAPEDDMRNSEY